MDIGATSSGTADGAISLMDQNATDPGPIDPYVLYDQENHVSAAVWEGQERGVLRCHEHTSKLGEWRLTHKQIELVEKAGFGYLRKLPSISLDNPLISALIERWRKETNTFHLRVGEMTVTLKDVALLLGLAIDGEPVLGVTYTSCKAVCEKFLGRIPDAGYMSGGMVKLSWLKEYFTQCPENAPLEDIKRYTRAYLLYLVGSTIFSTTTGNKVPIMYLPLFEDFDEAGKYAWGAAALAFLYRALGRATLKSQSTISGCLTLLQCWSYFHLNIGRPKFYQDPGRDCFPFVHWWKGKQSASTVKRDIIFYRKALDSLKLSDVEWLPYSNIDAALIPVDVRNSLILGKSKTMLICFDKAERHLPDRCVRQDGMLQGIPEDVQHWERKTRGVDSGINLSGKMESELNEWFARHHNIVQDNGGVDESEYMKWYSRITRKFVGRPVTPLPQVQKPVKFRTKKKRMNSGLRDIAHLADTFLIEGLDPMQIDSISRIRAIAHDCLGDHVEGATANTMDLVEGSTIADYVGGATTGDHVGDVTEADHGGATIADHAGVVTLGDHGGDVTIGDHVGGTTIVSTDSQNQLSKRKREKERVRRNSKGKRKRKDDPIPAEYYKAREFDPVHFYAAALRADPMQFCCHCRVMSHMSHMGHMSHLSDMNHIDYSAIKLAKKLKKKDKAKKKSSRKNSRKRKRKDERIQYDTAGGVVQSGLPISPTNDNQPQLHSVATNDDQTQLYHPDRDDKMQSYPAEIHIQYELQSISIKDNHTQPHSAGSEDQQIELYHPHSKDDHLTLLDATAVVESLQPCNGDVEFDHSLPCGPAIEGEQSNNSSQLCDPAAIEGELSHNPSQLCDTVAVDSEQSKNPSQLCGPTAAEGEQLHGHSPLCDPGDVKGEQLHGHSPPCDPAAVEGEQSQPKTHAAGEGAEAESSLSAIKVDDLKHSDTSTTPEINDLNISPVAGEILQQTAKMVDAAVPVSSIDTTNDEIDDQINAKVAPPTGGLW